MAIRLKHVIVMTIMNSIIAAADAYDGYPPLSPYSISYTEPDYLYSISPALIRLVPQSALPRRLYALNAPIKPVIIR